MSVPKRVSKVVAMLEARGFTVTPPRPDEDISDAAIAEAALRITELKEKRVDHMLRTQPLPPELTREIEGQVFKLKRLTMRRLRHDGRL